MTDVNGVPSLDSEAATAPPLASKRDDDEKKLMKSDGIGVDPEAVTALPPGIKRDVWKLKLSGELEVIFLIGSLEEYEDDHVIDDKYEPIAAMMLSMTTIMIRDALE